jgi:hypothetical protein
MTTSASPSRRGRAASPLAACPEIDDTEIPLYPFLGAFHPHAVVRIFLENLLF